MSRSRTSNANFFGIDYEDRLAKVDPNSVKDYKELVFFPENHVVVKKVPRKNKSGRKLLPDGIFKNLAPATMEIFNVFAQSKVIVEHVHKEYQKTKIDDSVFEKQKFAIDLESTELSQKQEKRKQKEIAKGVKVKLDLLDYTRQNAKETFLQHTHCRLFKLYDMAQPETSEWEWNGGAEAQICKRVVQKKKMALTKNDPFLIEILNFETALDQKFKRQLEPLFLSMCLFDTHQRCKISETFYFDFNSAEMLRLVGADPAKVDPSAKLHSVVFRVSQRTPDIVLYVKVYKVLQGDEDTAADYYLKPEKVKDEKKVQKVIEEYCGRLREFKQPIACAAVPVFHETTEDIILTSVEKFWRTKGNVSDEEFPKMFGSEGNSSQMRKLKAFPAKLELKVTELRNYKPKYIENEMVIVNNQEDEKGEGIMAKEMREFPNAPVMKFNSYYINFLYIYPQQLSLPTRGLSSKYARNITICIQVKENYNDLEGEGLPVIYGRSTAEPFLTKVAYSSVTHHNKHPEYNEEFKILLPTMLTPLHHILFTFYHVQCKPKTGRPTKTLLGYAIVPLLQDDMIINGRQKMKVYSEFASKTPYSEADGKLIDGGKRIFLVDFRAVSTVYPNDKYLANFYKHFALNVRSSISQHTDPDTSLSTAITGLKRTPPAILIQHLPVIFNQLLKTICSHFTQSKTIAFRTLLKLMDIVSAQSTTQTIRNELLVKYLDKMFQNFSSTKSGLVFEELAKQWLNLLEDIKKRRRELDAARNIQLHSDAPETKYPLHYSWMLFELIYKSMVLYLADNHKLKTDRKTRFSKEFCETLEKLVYVMADEIVYRSGVGLNLAKILNNNLALFLRDILNVMDRGFVLNLMAKFLDLTSKQNQNFEVLQEFRVTFIQIIVDFEHVVPMSLPLDYSVDDESELDHLIDERFMNGILLRQVKEDLVNKERTVRARVLNLLRDVLRKHEYDKRYQSATCRQRIAAIYFPFALLFMELFPEFREIAHQKKDKLEKTESKHYEELSEIRNKIKMLNDPDSGTKNEKNADLEALQKEEEKAKKMWEESKFQLEEEERRVRTEIQTAAIAFLYVVKHSTRELLRGWWKKAPREKVVAFLEVLHLCLTIFEYSGKLKITEKAASGVGTSTTTSLIQAKNALENMYTSLDRRTNYKASIKRRGGTLTRNFKVTRPTFTKPTTAERNTLKGESKEFIEQMMLWEGNLSTEVSASVIDVLDDFLQDFVSELTTILDVKQTKAQSQIMEWIYKFIVTLLGDQQSEKALNCTFGLLRIFIKDYRSFIFSSSTLNPFSETLCAALLRLCHCTYSEKIRTQATALLYSMLKTDYQYHGNFSKTKIQTTLALSKLVVNIDQTGIELLRASFEAISQYAKKDKIEPPQKVQQVGGKQKKETADFASQVQYLVERLGKTLLDTIKIKELEKTKADNEMMADLFLSIANGYRHAPELSVTWYSNLADHHKMNDRWIEAAQCIIYIASVSYMYLKLSNNPMALKIDFKHFLNVAAWLKKETYDDLKILFVENEKPIFESHYFTEAGFIQLIHKAIAYFNNASHFEFSVEMYKLLISIYENARDYENLQRVYSEISELYGQIGKANLKTTRLFGSFYKVGFYGKLFPDELNGKEFVYKMPRITRLAEIIEYLEKNFSRQLGEDKVKIVGDTFQTKGMDQQDEAAYIQITSVQPYYEDPNARTNYFERYTNIDQFIYETPFTKSGKSQGSLEEQYKRKTVVTLNCPFPWVLTRTLIQKKEDTILTPIENAMEIIDQSIQRLKDAIALDPPNISTLQLALSGNVIPQVNEGVPQIVNTFVLSKNSAQFDQKLLRQLKTKLREFLAWCLEGIKYSGKYSRQENKPLHEEFEKGYEILFEMFSKFIPNADELKLPKKQKKVMFAQ